MTLIKWHPMRELEDIRRDMDKMFGEFFEAPRRGGLLSRAIGRGVSVPSLELIDRKGEMVLRAELPGVKKEDVDITVQEEAITLKGQFKHDETVKDEDYYFSERRYGSFERTVPLPAEVDTGKAKATFKDGVLEVVLPKKKEAMPKEIKVEVN